MLQIFQESIESETAKGTEVLKEKLEVLQGKVKEVKYVLGKTVHR